MPNIICHDDTWTKDGSQHLLINMWGFEGNALRALYGEHYRDKKRRKQIMHGYIKIRPIKSVDSLAVSGADETLMTQSVMRYVMDNEKFMGLTFSYRDEYKYMSIYEKRQILNGKTV